MLRNKSGISLEKRSTTVTQRNFRPQQLYRVLCSLFCPLRKKNWKKKDMSIARWSERINCDSSFSKCVRAYSAHHRNPHMSEVEIVREITVHFSIKFHCFFHLLPALTFTLELLVIIIICDITCICFQFLSFHWQCVGSFCDCPEWLLWFCFTTFNRQHQQ